MKKLFLVPLLLVVALFDVGGAGGPIFPVSRFPVTSGFVFPNVHVGGGANSKEDVGLGVTDATTLTTDAIWRLRFRMPPTLPSGTAKLKIWALANLTTGDLKLNPKWAMVDAEASPSGATLNAEGTSTITWGVGDNDQYKELKILLDAVAVEAAKMLVMDLTIENTGTTTAGVVTMYVEVIWE